jgi:Tol biopolymer transport system component
MKIKHFFILCCFSLILAFIYAGQIHAQAPKTAKIVFASNLNVKAKDRSDIYIMNPDGTGRVNLTRHNAKDSEPTWSPSGRHILFTSDRDGGNDLYRMNADGTNIRRIFKKWAKRSNPAWSPDGQQIAYFREDEAAIYIADIDGANEKRLVNGWHPTWSPDGTEIAFVSLGDGLDIRVIDLKNRSERVLVPMEGALLQEPVWSPDGTKIAFNRVNFLLFILKVLFNAKDNPPTQTIDIVNSDGTEIEMVVVDGSQVSDPAWSPQSDALIYSQLSGKERHLFKISLGNLVSEQITQAGNNYGSDWFDPAILPVEPQPQLRLMPWSQIKTKTN